MECRGTHGATSAGATLSLRGERRLARTVLLQEIICDVGVQFHEHEGWVIVFGKNKGDWRGTGVAYTAEGMQHSNSFQLQCGIATTIRAGNLKGGIRLLSGHIPHHATLEQTEIITKSWESTLKKAKVIAGLDANWEPCCPVGSQRQPNSSRSTRTTPTTLPNALGDWTMSLCEGSTPSRGEWSWAAAVWHAPITIWFGERSTCNPWPSHRDQPGGGKTLQAGDQRHGTGGGASQADRGPPRNEGARPRHDRSGEVHEQIPRERRPQGGTKARRRAHAAAPAEARGAWKAVSRMRKQEMRQWHSKLADRASQIDWYAYRSFHRHNRREGWHHKLTDRGDWKKDANHFSKIFFQAPPQRTAKRLGDTRQAVTQLCKRTPWKPFTLDELRVAAVRWKSGKSTGPDAISHELLRFLMNDERWGCRLAHMMSDFLYKGELPEEVLKGMTILLPKTIEDPASWGDTRPITLSSSILKWFAQLLLKRCGDKIQRDAPYQWASKGKQAPELLVVLRRVVRLAKDFGTPTWIIKLDVKNRRSTAYPRRHSQTW